MGFWVGVWTHRRFVVSPKESYRRDPPRVFSAAKEAREYGETEYGKGNYFIEEERW